MLDNSMLPRNGIYLNANVDAAYKEFKSDVDYQQYQISLDKMLVALYHALS